MWNIFTRFSRSGLGGVMPTSGVTAPKEYPGEVSNDSSALLNDVASIDRIGSITIVTLLRSELTQHRGGPELADLLDELVASGHRLLVFDIQNVTFMDSRCVGCLVQAMNQLARQGGPDAGIALANPRSSVAHLFRLTRLDRVFPICADVLAAVNVLERRM